MSNDLQKIDFHGDDIFALKDEGTNKIYVSLRRICESLGISFQAQHRKLTSDPAFADSLRHHHMMTPTGKQDVLCIDSESLQGWLFSIQTNRLKPEIREKHLHYKRECFKVLHDYFTTGIAVHPESAILTGLVARVERLENLEKSSQKKQIGYSPERVKSVILEALSEGGQKSITELHNIFNRHISGKVLHSVLDKMLEAGEISIHLEISSGRGRPSTFIRGLDNIKQAAPLY